MSKELLEIQEELPKQFSLLKYAPQRRSFDWERWSPEEVNSSTDLPEYLMLGTLIQNNFKSDLDTWSAKWIGETDQTYLLIEFSKKEKRFTLQHYWHDLDGGNAFVPSKFSLGKMLSQSIYMTFPNSWDASFEELLKKKYQIDYFTQPEHNYNFCGIPDGPFRTIIIPSSINNLRTVQKTLSELINLKKPTYPINADVRLLFQAVNYIENKAPEWASDINSIIIYSLHESGLFPLGLPIKEVANDGSSALTLRRNIYAILISVPFAWLSTFLNELHSVGIIAGRDSMNIEYQFEPFIIPAGFEITTESVAMVNGDASIRKVLLLNDGQGSQPNLEKIKEIELQSEKLLNKAEELGQEIINAVNVL